ncbi:Guanosine-3',5'-bis(diphosphate) 3'-pyrophosphohydrolase / GTP pyrophosphokinase, (p)ppGpp synthetase II [hydrothermal vent metagenome]|uniref:Guanosine-3',5'-bis(Diphosphate) 3'-pyrophosphohydrolase / GTP pyrophosphokinase, (P)ppGpp synthetase II n=1 Tax=hydrothermal vent metagenome TaxID=652676 RepID=A0A3B0T3Q4_9ZZZZ
MMRQYELVERVTSYDPGADEALLNRAYVYAMRAHGSQTRASGDPYFSHPLEVAAILTELKLDDATIATALLHDTIEDTDATREEIDEIFGSEIGALVDGLTKINRLDLVSRQAAQAENLRKLLLAVADDARVLLVKLADRLHNMRTLDHVEVEKRARVAQETMDIYAPLAGRMGMQTMREELEDLAFAVLNPEARNTIVDRLNTIRNRSGELVQDISEALRARLAEAGITARIAGREKRPHSIWRKMERNQIALEQLSDIYGFRVLVGTNDECYRALGIIHQAWRVVPGRFKDYISTPKQNDYRSLHTTIVGPGSQRVELQVRTNDMHDVAEHGVAAHALYKDGAGNDGRQPLAKESNAYKWLRRLVEALEEGDNPEEFLEHTRLELFHDQVFCFTPMGNLITLPHGATPIDFAYAVHTDVGNTCVGCKINGRHSPLLSRLANGDEVEIIRSEAQTPPAAWEKLAVTGKARAAIRRATREVVRDQYVALGREILDRIMTRAGMTLDTGRLGEILPRLGRDTVDEVFIAIGRGELASDVVLREIGGPETADQDGHAAAPGGGRGDTLRGLGRALTRAYTLPLGLRRDKSGRDRRSRDKAGDAAALPIRGVRGGLAVKFSADYGVVPGDRIVGILNPGEGVTIYPIHADILRNFEDETHRWIDVAWDIDESRPERFVTCIRVFTLNEVGALGRIAQTIAEEDGNIDNLSMVMRSPDFYEMLIDIEVWNLTHLNRLISSLRRLGVVSKVERKAGPTS